jgi:hypothetical protein
MPPCRSDRLAGTEGQAEDEPIIPAIIKARRKPSTSARPKPSTEEILLGENVANSHAALKPSKRARSGTSGSQRGTTKRGKRAEAEHTSAAGPKDKGQKKKIAGKVLTVAYAGTC